MYSIYTYILLYVHVHIHIVLIKDRFKSQAVDIPIVSKGTGIPRPGLIPSVSAFCAPRLSSSRWTARFRPKSRPAADIGERCDPCLSHGTKGSQAKPRETKRNQSKTKTNTKKPKEIPGIPRVSPALRPRQGFIRCRACLRFQWFTHSQKKTLRAGSRGPKGPKGRGWADRGIGRSWRPRSHRIRA